MPNYVLRATLCSAAIFFAIGCNRKADNTMNFSNAIDTYYSAHPACIWSQPKRFPVQAATADEAKTSGYDALVDQSLLTRTTVEKKKFIIASEQVNNYDISDNGRSSWTADPNQPGYGNFCYGHRKVSSIISSTPTSDTIGATTQVTYQYSFTGAPAWASAPETQTAFPRVRADLSGPRNGQTTLTNTSNGWTVALTPSPNPDGAIVQ